MKSKARVIKALKHEEPDRVPVGEWGVDHDIVEKAIGHPTFWRAKANTTKALWDGRRDEVVESFKEDIVDLVEKLDHDLVPVHLVPPADYGPPKIEKIGPNSWEEPNGRVWKYSEGNDAILPVDEPMPEIENEGDLVEYFENTVVPRCGFKIKSKSSGDYDLELDDESRLELIDYVIDKVGDEKFVFARGFEEAVGSPDPLFYSEFESISLFFGINSEEYLKAIFKRPEMAKRAMRLYSNLAKRMTEIFIDAGVDGVMPQGDFADGTGPMINPESIREIFYPTMKEICEIGHDRGVKVLTHNCGNNWKLLDLFVEAGFDAWQSIEVESAGMDLEKLVEEYGEELTFWGGIDLNTLVSGEPDQVRDSVRESLEVAGPGGGLILGTSNSVAYGSNYDNYMAALETLRKHGNYPINNTLG